jgi:hypothetical protein
MADGELRKIFRANLKHFDWLAVETATDAGVPDANYCFNRHEGWIEMKRCRGLKVDVRSAQVGWAERRLRHGGKVFCAVRKEKAMWLFSGWDLRTLTTRRVDQVPPLGHWDGGQSAWGWGEIARILTGGS